jgi:hypothetical protein
MNVECFTKTEYKHAYVSYTIYCLQYNIVRTVTALYSFTNFTSAASVQYLP